MKLNNIINYMDSFLRKQISSDVFLDKVALTEENLLDMEEEVRDERLRNIILKALESLDNIRFVIDEPDLDRDVFILEMKKLLKFEEEYYKKPEDQINIKDKPEFMLSSPSFESHPGMKDRLPTQHTARPSELMNMVKDIKRFSRGEMNKYIILDKLEAVEDELLEMEELYSNNQKTRDLLVQSLEVLDDIRIIIDEDDIIDDESFKTELDNWMELQDALKDEFTPHTSPEGTVHSSKTEKECSDIHSDILKKSISSDISLTEKLSTKIESHLQSKGPEDFILSKPEFELHPGMKSRLPVEQPAEVLSPIDIKSSPLYDFFALARSYLSGYADFYEFKVILERTSQEILNIKKDIDAGPISEDDENENILGLVSMMENGYSYMDITRDADEVSSDQDRKLYSKILEDILDTLSYMHQTDVKNLEDLSLFLGDLEDLNRELILLQKQIFQPFQEIDEEEELVKTIVSNISEEDILTTNYLLVKETALSLLRDEIDEEEFINVLEEMREIIDESKDTYEIDYAFIDGWALESFVGDKMFREGIKEWNEALSCLYEYFRKEEKEKIFSGIEKAYEANKKLIINQKLEEYIQEQIRIKNEYKLNYFP